jgi:cofilin
MYLPIRPTWRTHPSNTVPNDICARCYYTTITQRALTIQNSECLEKFTELKTGKKLTYIIYGLSEDKRSIVVLKTSEEKDFDTFIGELPEKECRWAVYDFEYTLPGGEGIRNKLCFVMWWVFVTAERALWGNKIKDDADVDRSPDDANVRNKMVFASSKDALRRRLDGELLLPFSACLLGKKLMTRYPHWTPSYRL